MQWGCCPTYPSGQREINLNCIRNAQHAICSPCAVTFGTRAKRVALLWATPPSYHFKVKIGPVLYIML